MKRLLVFIFAILLIGLPASAWAGRDITVYAFHQPIEKIITYGHGGNYPECALVSLVLTEIDPDTGKRIFYRHIDNDSPLEIKVEANSSSQSLYAVTSIMEGPPFPLGGITSVDMSSGTPQWKGLFYGWGNCSASLPLDLDPGPESIPTLETARHNVDIATKAAFSPVVIVAVYSWNYHLGAEGIQLNISAKQVGSSVKVENPNITVSLNMDNIDLVRQKIPAGQEATFMGDPGLFIVKDGGKDYYGNYRRYDQIGQVISDIQRGNLQVSRGGGPDWLQVAAADMANKYYYPNLYFPNEDQKYLSLVKKVFDCLHKIQVGAHLENEAKDGTIFLYTEDEGIRFNKPGKSGYGFYAFHERDTLIKHETFHLYQTEPGKGWVVEDKDVDDLALGDLIVISADTLSRGFITLSYKYKSYVKNYLEGKYGDMNPQSKQYSRFLENLSLSGVQGDILKNEKNSFISSIAPKDLPATSIAMGSSPETYLYLGSPYFLEEKVSIGLTDKQPSVVKKRNCRDGYYDAWLPYFDVMKNNSEAHLKDLDRILQLSKQDYQLYLAFKKFYLYSPPEFDAEIFGLGGTLN
ncbi:MAG: hypothetical protein PHT31_05000 [Candidatus Omnitrophica bacterium]|nr:hypothetical protein [Candidatus Omnitrophota bacterium]MDD5653504.1 hypothetical protein [Candidatus Omnitrophota bacterium]